MWDSQVCASLLMTFAVTKALEDPIDLLRATKLLMFAICKHQGSDSVINAVSPTKAAWEALAGEDGRS